MAFSYLDLSGIFRKLYRERFMRASLRAELDGWPRLTISLAGIIDPQDAHSTAINRAIITVNYVDDLGPDAWALNFVTPTRDGSYMGNIDVSKSLYLKTESGNGDAIRIKTILAHEWLEVLCTLCNHPYLNGGRSIRADKAELYALTSTLEDPGAPPLAALPWLDSLTQINELLPGWRDLLVSRDTILRMISEDPDKRDYGTFYNKVLQAYHPGGEGVRYLRKFAEQISQKINVSTKLILFRVQEVVFGPPPAGR